jgi:hypothetical protein
MTDTGHKQRLMPDGRTLIEWITSTVEQECEVYGVDMPTPKQMAVVAKALRIHTIMVNAARYDISELGQSDEVTKYWPIESSIGRYLRDAPELTLESRVK